MSKSGFWLRRLITVGVGISVLVAGAGGLGVAGHVTDHPVYPTFEACWEAHKVPCGKSDKGWSPVEGGGTTGPGDAVKRDEEYLRRQRISMEQHVSGSPEHPVVAVDMNQVQFPDVQPYLDHSNRVRVPLRFVAEQMGAAVHWDERTNVVTVAGAEKVIRLDLDTGSVTVNGKEAADAATYVPPTMREGRVMVPLRFISEHFGATVDWVGSAPPFPGRDHWGKYQVWIWVPWGYWGQYTIQERFGVYRWWFTRAGRS